MSLLIGPTVQVFPNEIFDLPRGTSAATHATGSGVGLAADGALGSERYKSGAQIKKLPSRRQPCALGLPFPKV